MALDIKKIIGEAFLRLNATHSIDKISIADLLKESGVSRQTFYNHFLDKNDLIHYIYDTYIVPDYNDKHMDMKFYESLLISLENMKTYGKFMKEACMKDDQNCLKDYIIQHCENFDMKWHQSLYGIKPMPEALVFATKYHANASSNMTLSWIISDFSLPCKEMAEMITKMRSMGMEDLFKEGDFQGNPYC